MSPRTSRSDLELEIDEWRRIRAGKLVDDKARKDGKEGYRPSGKFRKENSIGALEVFR